MIQQNHFFAGVDMDTDPQLTKNNSLRDSSDIYLIDKDGQGFVATPVGGNELEFSLSQGFIPMGHEVLNGVAYIFSYNPATNEGEVGSFPSPIYDVNGDILGGWDRTYKPLRNWFDTLNPYLMIYNSPTDIPTMSLSQDFRTPLFNFDENNPISVKAKTSHDGAVDLYFTDYRNPIRTINTGFDFNTGFGSFENNNAVFGRSYYDGSFEQAINLFHETLHPPRIGRKTRLAIDPDTQSHSFGQAVTGRTWDLEPLEVLSGGKHKCGNHFIYLRYTNDTFNSTSFATEVGPIMIAPTSELQAGYAMCGGDSDIETSKKIKIHIDVSTLDESYKYLETAVVRYHGENLYEAWLVDKLWEVQGLIDPAVDGEIEITGYEERVVMTLDQIQARKRTDDIVKDIDNLENRLFGGNTQETDIWNPDLNAFALAIETMEDDTHNLNVPLLPDVHEDMEAITIDDAQYRNYEWAYKYTQYWRHETYPFAIKFLLNSGKVTEGYPIQGYDNQFGFHSSANEEGIFRFPRIASSPITNPTGTQLNVLGVKFRIQVNNTVFTQWIRDNVAGFWFCRGERKPNILYQGIALQCFDSDGPPWYGEYHPDTIASYGQFGATGCPRLGKKRKIYTYTRNIAPFFYQFPIWMDGPDGLASYARTYIPWKFYFRKMLIGPSGNTPGNMWGEGVYTNGFWGTNPSMGVPLSTSQEPDSNGFMSPNLCVPTAAYGQFGIISPDYCVNQIIGDRDYFINEIGQYKEHLVNFGLAFFANFLGNSGKQVSTGHNIYDLNKTLPGVAGAGIGNRPPISMDYYLAEHESIDPSSGASMTSKVWGIPDWVSVGKMRFASYYHEGIGMKPISDDPTDSADGASSEDLEYDSHERNDYQFYYQYSKKMGGHARTICSFGNMEMGISRYIGIDVDNARFSDGTTVPSAQINLHHHLLNLTDRDPGNIDIEDEYYVRNTFYHHISDFIPIIGDPAVPNARGFYDTNGNILNTVNPLEYFAEYRGDCFPQRNYIKTLFNPKYNIDAVDDNQSGELNTGKTLFTFGHTMGLVCEATHNVAMRHAESKELGKEIERETFYPYHEAGKPYEFSCLTRARESYRYNFGYSKVLGSIVTPGWDYTAVHEANGYPTRVFFTSEYTPGNVFDSWRLSAISDHQDYDYRMGQINAVISGSKKLYFIQRQGIGITAVNARALAAQDGGGDLILGTQVEVLHPKAVWVTDKYGTQQQRSVIATDNAIYGADWNKRKIWRLAYNDKFELISGSKKIRRFMYDVIEPTDISDVSVDIPDEPVVNGGVSVGYNKKYHEVVFSFIDDDSRKEDHHTIVFSEYLDAFVGRRKFTSPYYITINEDFYSTNIADLPVDNAVNPRGNFWLHDKFDTVGYVSYYGTQYEWYIKFIVNHPTDITKVFDALQINASDNLISAIRYTTQYQTADHSPFTGTARYLEPTYKEGAWRVPIRRADTATGTVNPSSISSRMRGKWIEVTIEYNSNESIFVKSVLTKLRQSLT